MYDDTHDSEAPFFSKTSQGILIHIFARFGRCLNAFRLCLVFGHILAMMRVATDAGPLMKALVSILIVTLIVNLYQGFSRCKPHRGAVFPLANHTVRFGAVIII